MLKHNSEMIKEGEGLWSQMNKSPGATKYRDFSKITKEEWEEAFKALDKMDEDRNRVESLYWLLALPDDDFISICKNPPKDITFIGGSKVHEAFDKRVKELNIISDD